ncbi:CGLAU_01105 family protein [Corynebacterium halotolerans]|nr:CGLAU_01105 family protein [Corynebacterium halotolerans]
MTTENPNQNATGDHGDKDSLLDNLREPFQAWLNAGSRLGDVVSDFADRFRDDRETSDNGSGAHARRSAVDGEETTLGRFRAASREAREKLSGARSTEELKSATSSFAGHAEDIIRDVAGSARRAADETRHSSSVDEAKDAFSRAVGSVRESFDETVEAVRARRAESGSGGSGDTGDDADGLIADLRQRLDDLIDRASTIGGGETKASTTGPSADPDIIEGEVISDDSTDKPDKDN